jgi:anaerobic ribonucleoside-triphosphate reductase
MKMRVIKRSGSEVEFDITKIIAAVNKANATVSDDKKLTKEQITELAADVEEVCKNIGRAVSVEEIQDMVENHIMAAGAFELARQYITYRYVQSLKRKANTTDEKILSLIECENEEVKQENSNKNPTVSSVQRDYMAGEVSKDLTERVLLSADVVEAHKQGILHFHDSDYFAQHMHNCDLVNLEDMLQNGTVISGTFIEKPHSFSTACNIATQIIAQVASSQYGGQSISLSHLAPFVDVSRKKIRAQVEEEMEGLSVSQERKDEIVDKRLRQEINKGVQTIQYQVVTLMTTNGQAPFITVFMYLNEAKNEREKEDLAMIIEEMIRQRHQGVKNEAGVWITPAFPKLIYVLEEDNIKKGSKYYHLTELAAKCTAKRLVPDYISEKKMLELKVDKNGEGHCYTCMGCRSFLTPYVDENGKAKYYGRFNQGVVTINLVDVALSSGGDVDRFWEIFEERLNLCHKALRARHERLLGTPSDVAPILWQYGALARLKKGEVIDKLLYGGYSTISLGYAGLYECVKYMTGKSHTDDCAKPFALAIMQKMNDKCKEWKEKENIDYSIYGTPLESTTYKFAKSLQKRFGVIEGITDKSYITNSYHVHVGEEIDAFTKLKFESDFQKLSPGGAISYVEVPNMQDNIDAVMSLLQFIYENIMYAELNTKSDYCQCCGYDGEIKIDDDHGKLVWVCPKCGNRDQSKLNVARRTCGYIGTQFWNQGRTQEIKDRVMHLSTLSDISIKGNLSHSSAV